jgi:hypothetical protein
MRTLSTKFVAVAGSLLVGTGFFGSSAASTVDTDAQLGTIPAAGAPSFVFDASGQNYSNTIQSWFSNILYVQSLGAGNGYSLFASQEGNFTYQENSTTSYQGTNGVFNMYAEFNDDGTMKAGTGMVAIAGKIPGIVDNPSTILMRATLTTDYAVSGNQAGFAMMVTECAVGITNCQMATPESVYLFTVGNFPDIAGLNGQNYQTTLASISTVPIPAGVWLMISALALLGHLANRKHAATA